MKRVRVWLATTLLLIGCARGLQPADPYAQPMDVLARSHARDFPSLQRARLHLKVASEPLDIASGTGGVLIVDGPDRTHLAVMGPLGAPLATATSDGLGLAVAWPRDRHMMTALDAETHLREATGGLLGLTDLTGLMLGQLPMKDASVRRKLRLNSGQVEVELEGPNRSRMAVILDSQTATPVSLLVTEKTGRTVLAASYGPFEPDAREHLVPSEVRLEVPQLELTLELRYKSWTALDEAPPVFSLALPDGWSSERLQDALTRMPTSRLESGTEGG